MGVGCCEGGRGERPRGGKGGGRGGEVAGAAAAEGHFGGVGGVGFVEGEGGRGGGGGGHVGGRWGGGGSVVEVWETSLVWAVGDVFEDECVAHRYVGVVGERRLGVLCDGRVVVFGWMLDRVVDVFDV